MDKFHCIECGTDISDLPAKCTKCGHSYSYAVERPELGFWASFRVGFIKVFWWLIVALGGVFWLLNQS